MAAGSIPAAEIAAAGRGATEEGVAAGEGADFQQLMSEERPLSTTAAAVGRETAAAAGREAAATLAKQLRLEC